MPALSVEDVVGVDLWGALSSEDTALDWQNEELGVRFTLAKPGDETDPESDDEAETLSPRVLGWEDDVKLLSSASDEDCGALFAGLTRHGPALADPFPFHRSNPRRGATRGTRRRLRGFWELCHLSDSATEGRPGGPEAHCEDGQDEVEGIRLPREQSEVGLSRRAAKALGEGGFCNANGTRSRAHDRQPGLADTT